MSFPEVTVMNLCCGLDIEGSQPEWCISSMTNRRDTPFWSDTIDMIHGHCSCVFKEAMEMKHQCSYHTVPLVADVRE